MQILHRTARLALCVSMAATLLFSPSAVAAAFSAPTTPDLVPTDSTKATKAGPSYRDTLSTLNDSMALAHLRDSLHRILRARTSNLTDARPGRKLLQSAEPSLFASHTGSVGLDYPLGPGDALILSLWGQKQARYDLEINRDGQVELPNVGVVSLNGTTFGEAHKLFAKRLATVYSGINSGTTQFDLTMQKLKQIRIFVVGDVEKPGGYILSGNTSALQAMTLSGGPTSRGSERIVQVTRGDSTFSIDLYSYLFLARRPKRDVLQDGDIVRVPAAKGTVHVTGASARPGTYEISERETLADVLAYSGGFVVDHDPDAPIILVRNHGEKQIASVLGTSRELAQTAKTTAIQAGDRIQIPSKPTTKRASPVVIGAVRNPGSFPYSQGLTVPQLVTLAGGPKSSALKTRVVVFRFDSTGISSVLRTDLGSKPEMTVFPMDSVVVSARDNADADTSFQVEILGAVRNPGMYPWAPGMFAKDLVVLAGGFLPSAEVKTIRIEQPDPTGSTSKASFLNIDADLTIEPEELPIRPRSLVFVGAMENLAPQGKCMVTGFVQAPGAYAILSPTERVASVVRRAGGLSPSAFVQGAYLWRASEGRIPLDLQRALKKANSDDNVLLQSGDSLHIPATPATVKVAGRVQKPTQVLWRDGEGWKWYVQAAGGFADSANRAGVHIQYADGSIRSFDQGLDDPTPGSTVFVPRTDPPRTSTAIEKISAFGTIASAAATLLTAYILYTTTSK